MPFTSIWRIGLLSASARPGLLSSFGKTSTQLIFNLSRHLVSFLSCSLKSIPFSITLFWKWNRFHYMAMADNRQRYMPLPEDRSPPRGQQLAYPEAVLLVNPIEPSLQGEVRTISLPHTIPTGCETISVGRVVTVPWLQVDDKYQYSCDNKDSQVHGWICTENSPVGFWMITPSNEFRTGGPVKQNLTSHVGPTTLAVSDHFLLLQLSALDRIGPGPCQSPDWVLVYIYI